MHHAQSLLYGRHDDPAKLDQGIDQCRRALDQYQVLDNPDWEQLSQVRNLDASDREQLRQDVGEALFWAAGASLQKFEIRNPKSEIGLKPTNSASTVPRSEGRSTGSEDLLVALNLSQSAGRCYDVDEVPPAIWLQQAELLRHQGRIGEADVLSEKAEKTPCERLRTAICPPIF